MPFLLIYFLWLRMYVILHQGIMGRARILFQILLHMSEIGAERLIGLLGVIKEQS